MLLRGPRCIRLLFWRFPSPKQYSQANYLNRKDYQQAQSNAQDKQQYNKNGHCQNCSVHQHMHLVFRHRESSRCAHLGISSTGFRCETVKLHQNGLLSHGLLTFYPYFSQKSIGRIRQLSPPHFLTFCAKRQMCGMSGHFPSFLWQNGVQVGQLCGKNQFFPAERYRQAFPVSAPISTAQTAVMPAERRM